MYRKIFTCLFLFASLNIAQSLTVINTEKLIPGEQERLYFPRFSPDGNYITMSKSNFKGLWLYNLSQKELIKINDNFGSGFEPFFTDDSTIHFQIDEYINKRRIQIPKVYNTINGLETNDTSKLSLNISVKSGSSSIVISEKDKTRNLKPMGEGAYVWVSLSPDKDKILFTLLGKGTFVCDLEGRIISELGYANAPSWSPKGNWITYMVDKDDGISYISSDIFISSLNGKTKFNLTNTKDDIEMYPDWSPDGKKIVYNNLSGDIIISEFEIK